MHAKELLMSIMKYGFYALDLNLYLDNHPDDCDATEDYCAVSSKLQSLMNEYEKKYGPLTNFGTAYQENPKAWVEQPWPWEKC